MSENSEPVKPKRGPGRPKGSRNRAGDDRAVPLPSSSPKKRVSWVIGRYEKGLAALEEANAIPLARLKEKGQDLEPNELRDLLTVVNGNLQAQARITDAVAKLLGVQKLDPQDDKGRQQDETGGWLKAGYGDEDD